MAHELSTHFGSFLMQYITNSVQMFYLMTLSDVRRTRCVDVWLPGCQAACRRTKSATTNSRSAMAMVLQLQHFTDNTTHLLLDSMLTQTQQANSMI